MALATNTFHLQTLLQFFGKIPSILAAFGLVDQG